MPLDSRAAAATAIGSVLGGRSLDRALSAALELVTQRDRGFVQQLCYGTLRQAPRLQGVLEQLLDRPLRDRDRDLHGLLLVGLYQLTGTRVPDHAAVAATVAATRALQKDWARGLANAVLRRFLRERDTLVAALDPAAANAHPGWLFHRLHEQWPDQLPAIVEAGNRQPPMTLRVNTLHQSREAYLARLADCGLAAAPGALADTAVYLADAVDVDALPGFAEGAVSVQDEAAQLAAGLLGAGPGERVLDACAAPGGKTCHLLESQPALAEMIAMDIDETRLARVRDNLKRLDQKATVIAADAAQPPTQLRAGSFDRILVDAPCSASGVIRRHPDIKLLRRETDIPQLAARQLAILRGLWPLLRAGGCLLYVTCSILEEENSAVIEEFQRQHASARMEPPAVHWGVALDGGRQLLPAADGPDGLFYSLLRRTG